MGSCCRHINNRRGFQLSADIFSARKLSKMKELRHSEIVGGVYKSLYKNGATLLSLGQPPSLKLNPASIVDQRQTLVIRSTGTPFL